MEPRLRASLCRLLFAPDHAPTRVVLGLGLAAVLVGPTHGLAAWSTLVVSALLLLGRRLA